MAETLLTEVQRPTRNSLAGRYLLFWIGDTLCALRQTEIREVLSGKKVSRVGEMSANVIGFVTPRFGQAWGVIDLRLRFGLPAIQLTGNSHVLILNQASPRSGKKFPVGALAVDSLGPTETISADHVRLRPCARLAVDQRFVLGVAWLSCLPVALLNLSELLRED